MSYLDPKSVQTPEGVPQDVMDAACAVITGLINEDSSLMERAMLDLGGLWSATDARALLAAYQEAVRQGLIGEHRPEAPARVKTIREGTIVTCDWGAAPDLTSEDFLAGVREWPQRYASPGPDLTLEDFQAACRNMVAPAASFWRAVAPMVYNCCCVYPDPDAHGVCACGRPLVRP